MNKNKRYWWVIANSVDEAKSLSVEAKRAKSPSGANVIADHTNFYLNMSRAREATLRVLNEGRKGVVRLRLPCNTSDLYDWE